MTETAVSTVRPDPAAQVAFVLSATSTSDLGLFRFVEGRGTGRSIQALVLEKPGHLVRDLDVVQVRQGKCVLPRMPICGRCTSVALPPCRLMAWVHSLAIARRTRQLSSPKFGVGCSGMLSP